MVKAAVFMSAFYLVYSILLSRDTSYKRNRYFILLSLALSFILPFYTLQTLRPREIQVFGKMLSDVFVSAQAVNPETVSQQTTTSDSFQIFFTLYISVAVVFLLKFMFDLLCLIFLIVRQRNEGSRIIRFNGFNTAGFSAMGYIFINTRLSPEEAGEIIKHEQNHLSQNHFLDIVFIEIIKALQWFNPVIYLFNLAIRAVHEYQADEECLNSGVPIVNYQSLLLSQIFKSRAFNLTNSFSNPSLVKKRMIMMTKERTKTLADIKMIIVLPVIALVCLAISAYKEIPVITEMQTVTERLTETSSPVAPTTSQATIPAAEPIRIISSPASETRARTTPPTNPTINKENTNTPPEQTPQILPSMAEPGEKTITQEETNPFVVVEEMPMFPGGDVELLKFIGTNTVYPESAKSSNIQGRVIVRFCVTSKGKIDLISILKGVSPDLDAEAVRVVKSLPEFKPGRQGGKPVPVWYMVPITFTLK